jgi:hypothetical protein
LNPPDYKNKIVLTNPPYLAKNKNKDKVLYNLYNTSDLYKCFLKTISDCEGGVLIIPLNFFCDEDRTSRNLFFEKFEIIQLNIFEEQIFADTSYNICSFSFRKKNNIISEIPTLIQPHNKIIISNFSKETNYKFGNDFLHLIQNQKNIGISRLRVGDKSNSKIFLRAIDTGKENGKIKLFLRDDVFYGKNTDRSFASINLDKDYDLKIQENICLEFNTLLNFYREKYHSLFLTNFRNSNEYARKRISFDVVYKLISYIITNKI